ncbi:hypothetical protein H5410_044786 [Solanum commersonii]|uniref:Uncharacterized protein n=1 Tax=Solanum commersonii TaxID=4109 RepID=A0A9J5XBV6_SOLCO|nr:hypothetical protein H5410_044786 [Solanum commersonii]
MQRNPEPPAVQINTTQKIDPTHFLFFLTLTKKRQFPTSKSAAIHSSQTAESPKSNRVCPHQPVPV